MNGQNHPNRRMRRSQAARNWLQPEENLRSSSPKAIRLLLNVERVLIRDAISAFLKSHKDIRVVGSASNFNILSLSKRHKPDIILYETRVSARQDVCLVRKILSLIPATKIILLSSSKQPEDSLALVRAGAVGYATLYNSFDVLLKVIRGTYKDGTSLPRSLTLPLLKIAGSQSERIGSIDLTDSEIMVLKQVTAGKSNKEIAKFLGCKLQTVKNHLYHIYKKLNATTRTQAVLAAIAQGFLEK